MAARLSVMAGDLRDVELQRIIDILKACSCRLHPGGMTAADFMRLMVRDKKVLDGKLRLVLMKSLGNAYVSDQFSVVDLQAMLDQTCEQ